MRGIELKVKRIERRISVKDLAEAMGKTSSRVSHIESQDIVTARAAGEYLAALSQFGKAA